MSRQNPQKLHKRKGGGRQWLPADSALWHTLDIVSTIQQRNIPRQRVATVFPLKENEIALTSGNFNIDSMRAIGDGSYVHNSSFVFGTGLIGAALTVGTLTASAAGNASRRAAAAADAQVTWRPAFQGMLTVTNRGFYLQTPEGLFWWNWESITLLEIQNFSVLVMQGQGDSGPVTWRIWSDWAELIFALWALHVHPNHPQFLAGSWVPPNWVEWAATQGYPVHPNARELLA